MKSEEKKTAQHGIWREYTVPQDSPLKINIGPLVIWCIREKQELRVAWRQISDAEAMAEAQPPEDKEWQRWAFKQETPKIELKPVFPDRPVLVKPENPFRIAEDARVRIFVRVPIWVRINLLGKIITNLIEIPVITLSNSWFGIPQEGELCYWQSSGARLVTEPDTTRPFMAICPINIIDQSPEDLDVEKICLRVINLSLFLHENQLWADETKLIYRGKSEVGEIDVARKAPTEAKGAPLISPPREALKKSFSARSFASIKDFSGLGFLHSKE